ncbi:hypothetical protein HaLaN_18393, partial [Haematococcus lacustris]
RVWRAGTHSWNLIPAFVPAFVPAFSANCLLSRFSPIKQGYEGAGGLTCSNKPYMQTRAFESQTNDTPPDTAIVVRPYSSGNRFGQLGGQ